MTESKNKRIFFVGSHCTGKTTLARVTSEIYGVPMLPEVARLVLARKELNFDKLRHDLKTVNDYQKSVFEEQIEAEKTLGHFVSDRGFDNLAYAAEHSTIFKSGGRSRDYDGSNESKIRGGIFGSAFNYLEELSECSRPNGNTKVFFVRPSKALMKDDGVRESLDWDGMCRIDGMVKFMLEFFDVNYVSINTTNFQERIRIVRSCVGDWLTLAVPEVL